MVSRRRPLPGVRLDGPGDLVVPECEWYISPLGPSHFVNHNTRTTSWKKPVPEHPAESLKPEYIVEGHSKCIWSLACFDTGRIMSASSDGSLLQWERNGERVEKLWNGDGEVVCSMALSPDKIMFVIGGAVGKLRLWNIKEGIVVGKPWKGHEVAVRCLDWSPKGQEIASGSQDGTIRRWNPDTGRQITPLIETGHGWVLCLKYSPQGDQFASCGMDKMIRLWSKDGEPLVEIDGHDDWVWSLCWSKDGAHIFSASSDTTIRKWQSIDGEELIILRGHTNAVTSLCLSTDESHLFSASMDCSVCIWDLKINQQVRQSLMHDNLLLAITVSPDGKYVASAGLDAKVYVWSLEAVFKEQNGNQVDSAHDCNVEPDTKFKTLGTPPIPRQLANNRGLGRYGDDFWSSSTNPMPRRSDQFAGPSLRLRLRNLFGSLRFSTQPANAPQQLPLQPWRWNFRFIPFVDVSHAQDEDRYGMTPETDAEAAAAMQRTSDNNTDSLMQQGQGVAGTQESHAVLQGRPTHFTQDQNSVAGTGEPSHVIGCCGLYLYVQVRRGPRRTSDQRLCASRISSLSISSLPIYTHCSSSMTELAFILCRFLSQFSIAAS